MAKISVVMCCYNSERYIKETIDSVLGQTLQDFEFIIWNDGSTDSTKAIVESYHDPRIRLYSDVNRGEGMAAQLACRHVTAKYIARIDSDDVWLPEKLALQYDYMESHLQTVMISCPVIFIDENSKELGCSFPVTRLSYLNKSITTDNKFPHSGSIYRTEIYKKVGGYNNVRYCQDRLLFWKMSDYGDLALFPRPLIKYRLLASSVAHRIDSSPYKDIIWAFRDKIYKDKGTNETDLRLYNTIYDMVEKKDKEVFVYSPDAQNRLYYFLCKFMSETTAYQLMVGLKNALSFIKS